MEAPATPVSPWRRRYAAYMFVVGIGGNLLFYLQAWKIFANRSAGDVSLPAFIVGLWAVTSWFFYGVMLRDKVILAANAVAIVGCLLVIAGWVLYG